MARDFTGVGVVGLGTMGTGIVEVLARSGIEGVAVAVDQAALDRASGRLTASTERAVAGGKLSGAERDALFERLGGGHDHHHEEA